MTLNVYFLIIFFLIQLRNASNSGELDTSKKDIQIDNGFDDYFHLIFRSDTNATTNDSTVISVSFDCAAKCQIFAVNPKTLTLTTSNQSYQQKITVTGLKAGHDTLFVITNDSTVDDSNAFVRVRIGHNSMLNIISLTVGWMYFVIWSASFWPQNITNYRRKSVIGLNLDFATLNVTGFFYYSVFNVSMYYSSTVRQLYSTKFPRSEIPIELNDVVYGLHAFFATAITLFQCAIYERGDQRLSLFAKLFLALTLSAAVVQSVVCIAWSQYESWLTLLLYLSYVKLAVTCSKYAPQVWLNFKRKSTKGWTVWMVWMDVSGGFLGLMQMLLNAYNYNDWITIFGNFAKFGLSVASIVYDVIFLTQHKLYTKTSERTPKALILALDKH